MMLDDYTVPNKEQRISVAMRFEADTLGAQTSGTDTAHKGIKPKVVTVALVIPFVDISQLSELTAIAEAIEDDGSLKIYDITETAANAMKIRRVHFTDAFNVREDWRLKAWQVNFTLQEFQSVPEKTEQRQEKVIAVAQEAPGQVIGMPIIPYGNKASFQQIISNLDSVLAPPMVAGNFSLQVPNSTNEIT